MTIPQALPLSPNFCLHVGEPGGMRLGRDHVQRLLTDNHIKPGISLDHTGNDTTLYWEQDNIVMGIRLHTGNEGIHHTEGETTSQCWSSVLPGTCIMMANIFKTVDFHIILSHCSHYYRQFKRGGPGSAREH